MTCADCGGYVEWKGPITDLTHTECEHCGAINDQVPEGMELSYFAEDDDRD
jgi:Zn finger protein HypA/HybF involved in hydrogenase expression